ncbi:MAG: DUF4440 domain-containing protein [Xanthomonadales bacterium]|nr:DUF4440 domain-containing protein [Xanthomonadales bacterium]
MDSFELVKQLEVELHKPMVRSDAERVSALLHESFTEIGRSGWYYNRNEIMKELSKEEAGSPVWAQDFVTSEISGGLILLTYKSAHINTEGELSGHTFRSSLWQQTPQGWQVRFHQGTPISAFVRHAT